MHKAWRGMWRGTGRGAVGPLVAGPLLAGAVAGLVAGCMGGAGTGQPAGGGAPPPAAHKSIPYSLYTHCGIYQANVQGRWYLTTPALSDGNGNPPAGWGNPDQRGTMTLVSTAEVVFTDQAGHRVVFHAAPATGRYPDRICS